LVAAAGLSGSIATGPPQRSRRTDAARSESFPPRGGGGPESELRDPPRVRTSGATAREGCPPSRTAPGRSVRDTSVSSSPPLRRIRFAGSVGADGTPFGVTRFVGSTTALSRPDSATLAPSPEPATVDVGSVSPASKGNQPMEGQRGVRRPATVGVRLRLLRSNNPLKSSKRHEGIGRGDAVQRSDGARAHLRDSPGNRCAHRSAWVLRRVERRRGNRPCRARTAHRPPIPSSDVARRCEAREATGRETRRTSSGIGLQYTRYLRAEKTVEVARTTRTERDPIAWQRLAEGAAWKHEAPRVDARRQVGGEAPTRTNPTRGRSDRVRGT